MLNSQTIAVLAGAAMIAGALIYTQNPNMFAPKSEFEFARRAVRSELVDPESATFRNESSSVLGNGHAVYCGEVNGRNRLGGYSGWQEYNVFQYPTKTEVSFYPIGTRSAAGTLCK